MKGLFLQLRNRKSKKDTISGNRSTFMLNSYEKQKKAEIRRHRDGLGKII